MGESRIVGVIVVIMVLITATMTSVWAEEAVVAEPEPELDAVPASAAAHDSVGYRQAAAATEWLMLDDGSAEGNLGVIVDASSTSVQFIWLNRFTPAASQFPFRLKQIHVFFDGTSKGAKPGDDIDLVVYSDADGDPSNGATLLATFNETVKAADGSTWSVYDLSPSVLVTGPGDVLIGVINRFVDSGVTSATYPAAQDGDSSQGRSWIGWWDGADPPDPAVLPPNSVFSLVDSLGSPGNWMIRGFAETSAPSAIQAYFPLLVRSVVLVDEYEPNNRWTDAYGPLISNYTYQAVADDTEDYYFFNLSVRAEVSVSVDNYLPTSSNGTVMLYGPATGDELGALIEYYGVAAQTSMSLGPHTLEPGKYYIRVRTVDGYYETSAYYSLTASWHGASGCPPGTLTPNDPGFAQQWGMAKINAPRAWFCGFTGASDAVVAVLDTGVDLDHPEFAGRLVAGWDWANSDSSPDDDHGHGSHVAGIAGAIGNNGAGVAGVGWNTSIMPLKVLEADGSGFISWSTDAVGWAADHGADVINMSLGSTYRSQALQDAINYARNQGVLTVASAGNCGDASYWLNGCDYVDQPNYPGAYDNVVAVASTESNDTQSSFSNEGSYVDLAAPGSSIYSTYRDGGYYSGSGTSQSSPHVAGLAALIKAANPSFTPAQIASAMQSSAIDLGAAGRDNRYGWGRIDAAAALGVATAAATTADSAGVSSEPVTRESDAEIAPGRVLVRLQPGVAAQTALSALADAGLGAQVTAAVPQIEVLVLSVPEGAEWDVIEWLQSLPQVVYAEPDLVVRLY